MTTPERQKFNQLSAESRELSQYALRDMLSHFTGAMMGMVNYEDVPQKIREEIVKNYERSLNYAKS